MINLKYKYEDVIKYWQEQKLESKEDYMNILENSVSYLPIILVRLKMIK